MNVAIDKLESHLDVKHTGRVLTALDNAQVSFAKRLLNRQTMNRTPVEDHELEETVSTPLSRAREKSAKPDPFFCKIINLEKLGQMFATKQVPDANRQAFGSRKRSDGIALTPALKGYRGIGQRDSLQPMDDMRGLGLLAAKKLAAGGKVEEKISHLDVCPGGNPDVTNRLDLASGHNHFGAGISARLTRRQSKSRHAGDAGQCLTAKTHRANAGKI
jgi:hypothetical protein